MRFACIVVCLAVSLLVVSAQDEGKPVDGNNEKPDNDKREEPVADPAATEQATTMIILSIETATFTTTMTTATPESSTTTSAITTSMTSVVTTSPETTPATSTATPTQQTTTTSSTQTSAASSSTKTSRSSPTTSAAIATTTTSTAAAADSTTTTAEAEVITSEPKSAMTTSKMTEYSTTTMTKETTVEGEGGTAAVSVETVSAMKVNGAVKKTTEALGGRGALVDWEYVVIVAVAALWIAAIVVAVFGLVKWRKARVANINAEPELPGMYEQPPVMYSTDDPSVAQPRPETAPRRPCYTFHLPR